MRTNNFFKQILTAIFKQDKSEKMSLIAYGNRYSEKNKQVVLHICNILGKEPTFGSTVLNKVLFYIDKLCYIKTGKVLTGFKYYKNKHGITPAWNQLKPVLDRLEDEKLLNIKWDIYWPWTKRKFIGLSNANLETYFNADEIADINNVIDEFKNLNADEASKKTKNEAVYQNSKLNEELKPEAFLISKGEVKEKHIEWAKKKIDEFRKRKPAISN